MKRFILFVFFMNLFIFLGTSAIAQCTKWACHYWINRLIWEPKIRLYAAFEGIDSNLAVAVAEQESGLNPYAKDPSGTIGLFQVTGGLNKDPRYSLLDRKIPDQNIQIGVRHLKFLLKKYNNNKLKALNAYNGLSKNKHYAKDVMTRYDRIKLGIPLYI